MADPKPAPKPDSETDPKDAAPAEKPVAPPSYAKRTAEKINRFFSTREPRLVPSIITGILVLILLSLGTWQILRLGDKNEMLASIKNHLAEAPVDLRAKPPQNDTEWTSYAFRAVAVQGKFLPLYAFRLMPRTYEGEVGYHQIIPLKLQDGQIILINRGFVAEGAALIPPDEEKVFALQGILRVPESRKTPVTPQNQPSKNQWTWIDLVAMRHEIGVNAVAPVVLYETRKEGYDGYPIAGQLPLPTHNRHRHYAATWYALALILMGVYMMSMGPKQANKPAEDKAAANDDEALNDPVARRGKYPEATD
jgi:surfeit locus 1 family protein